MMNIAFYAPMKSPYHKRVSGDVVIGRNFLKALNHLNDCNDVGNRYTVTLASEFSSWEGHGNEEKQNHIKQNALSIASQLLDFYKANPMAKPQLWFTYHCYHKAPDWIGKTVSSGLNIPYIIAEFSLAHKQANGRWKLGYQSSIESLKQANAIIINNDNDRAVIESFINDNSQCKTSLYDLKPFLPNHNYFNANRKPIANEGCLPQSMLDEFKQKTLIAVKHNLDAEKHWLLIVAQMRTGDKMASYQLVMSAVTGLFAQASDVGVPPIQCVIVGDGKGFAEIERWATALNRDEENIVRLLGAVPNEDVIELMAFSRMLYWPGINEAIGLIFLEAMSVGLPVITCASADQVGGVKNVVYDQKTGIIVNDFNINNQIDAINTLCKNDDLHRYFSQQSLLMYQQRHSMQYAVDQLQSIILPLTSDID